MDKKQGMYEAIVKKRSDELVNLVSWFIDNDQKWLATKISETADYFSIPTDSTLEGMFNWVWWHPESAQYWINILRDRRNLHGNDLSIED